MGPVCQTSKDVKATTGAAKKTDSGKYPLWILSLPILL